MGGWGPVPHFSAGCSGIPSGPQGSGNCGSYLSLSGMRYGSRNVTVPRNRGPQKLLGSQMTSAVAMLKKMRATARITILRRRSAHFSPTPQRKRTIAKIRVVRI